MTRRRWIVAIVVACNPDPFAGNVSQSQFFEYHDQVREPLCPTLLSALDRHAQMIGGKIGLQLDGSRPRFRYYKFRDQMAFAGSGCPEEWGACAREDAVYSTTFFNAHEQTHDYVFRAWGGHSNGLLDEGEAVALACSPFYALGPGQKPIDVVGPLDWRDLLNLYGDSREGYGAAGFFITYLAEHYGWPSVRALHRKVPDGASAFYFAAAFAQSFPLSIDEAWSATLGTVGAPPCEKDWQCIATPIAIGESSTPDCDGLMHRSVDVSTVGGIVLSMTGVDSQLVLLSCSDSAPTPYTLEGGSLGKPATHWASLPMGTYTMVSGTPSSVTLKSEFQGSLVDKACAGATVALDPNGTTYVDFLRPRLDGSMRLAGGGRTYEVYPYNLVIAPFPGDPRALSICDDCTLASCVPVQPAGPTRVRVGDQSVVHFEGVVTLPPRSSAWGQLIFEVSSSGP